MGKFVTTIEGVVGRDPAAKFTPTGKAVVDVAVAVSSRAKVGQDEWKDTPTAWFKVTLWEQEAEWVTDNVAKGSIFTATGEVIVEEYQKNDGTPGWSLLMPKPETWGVKPKRQKQQAKEPVQGGADPWA